MVEQSFCHAVLLRFPCYFVPAADLPSLLTTNVLVNM